ncbi:uncharacterized protein N0V89_006467 [Didymosphaeria variabile]|uniref:MARVEL domain-containing protein n=1 Tax=Didymosphaeria variabile TaxID=1932322 RepID=A0A9W9C9B1_9PLEO|nr:uncharacterized protein N0V89_006467 [Didymosphaeria variabile]KAJ4351128.1 hypothetical protein N0V89_006467 [Didymosphaeria variabile]
MGLLSRFFYLINLANTPANGRLIYAEVISVLEIVFSILLIVPAKYSFYVFPIDVVLFICSIVAFGLLANLNSSCTSNWYYSYWGFYWGRFWRVPDVSIATIGSMKEMILRKKHHERDAVTDPEAQF